jgi:hypothetical protein
MRKHRLFIWSLVVSMFLCPMTFTQVLHPRDFKHWTKFASDPSSHFNYEKLLSRFQNDDSTLTDDELVLLSHGYTLRPEYDPYTQMLIEDSLDQFFREGEYESAMERGVKYLQENPVSLIGNLVLLMSSKHLEQSEDIEKYHTRFSQMLRAILATGTGNSSDSAFAVINIRDEYAVLNYFGYTSSSQSLVVGREGRSYDRLVGTPRNDSGKTRVFYFDITRPMNSLARQSPKK